LQNHSIFSYWHINDLGLLNVKLNKHNKLIIHWCRSSIKLTKINFLIYYSDFNKIIFQITRNLCFTHARSCNICLGIHCITTCWASCRKDLRLYLVWWICKLNIYILVTDADKIVSSVKRIVNTSSIYILEILSITSSELYNCIIYVWRRQAKEKILLCTITV
jgi:hypothetical protein